jgi:hypothetical protein
VWFDGRRFRGQKSVAIWVTVRRPGAVEEVRLTVSADCRDDVIWNPRDVDFGHVRVGQARSQTVDFEYAGPFAWQVTEAVVPKGAPFEATVKELYRRPGRIGYQVEVSLKKSAAPGWYRETILIRTNEPTNNSFPLSVDAGIVALPAAIPVK